MQKWIKVSSTRTVSEERFKRLCKEAKSFGSLLDDPDFSRLMDLHRAGADDGVVADKLRAKLAIKHNLTLDAVRAHADVQSGRV